MDRNLKGRRALVTGSTAGIGLAIATSLAREGARVVVTGRTQTGVDKAVGEVKAATGGEVVGFAGDLGTAWLIFTCAMACDTAATATVPSASAVPVSSTRREMRWQSFLPLFMIELPSGLVLAFFEPEVRG
jgi:NAD(P)-dependent dehydrogenase (short-subunit alcohol dehydrogenase family)